VLSLELTNLLEQLLRFLIMVALQIVKEFHI